jgi:hypothetical protein
MCGKYEHVYADAEKYMQVCHELSRMNVNN